MGVGLAHNREALEAALAGHVTVTATLADIDFTAFDTAELLALQSEREQHARTQAMIDHRIQSALMARATPHEIGGKSWTDVLATRMRISRKEASRRVAAAENLGPRYSLTGEVLAPALPACADALRSRIDQHRTHHDHPRHGGESRKLPQHSRTRTDRI